jgi:UDP-glucose:(heptosyl)LPS alpha-1,3-glucosyltransferase
MNLYLERKIYQHGNHKIIVANSRLCKGHVERHYKVPSHRVQVVYNGLDHGVFNPEGISHLRGAMQQQLGISPATPVILFISNNWKRKGLSTLMKAVAGAGPRCSPFHIVIVGRGNRKPFERLANRLGFGDHVHFEAPSRHIEKYYALGDVLVLPTLYDPFANACLEAMGCGLPVITTAHNGASELIRDGHNGYVLKDSTDAEELARLLTQCTDLSDLKEMGRAARETSLKFTFETNALQTLDICRRLRENAEDGGK